MDIQTDGSDTLGKVGPDGALCPRNLSTRLPQNPMQKSTSRRRWRKKQRPAMVMKEILYPGVCALCKNRTMYCGKIRTSASSYYVALLALHACLPVRIRRRHRETSAFVSMMTWV